MKVMFNILSGKHCHCGKGIKQNLVNKKGEVLGLECYSCYHNSHIKTRKGYHGNGRQAKA